MSEEEKQFILSNIEADVSKLLLNPPKGFRDNIQSLVEQIQSRQKAKNKLPSWYSNPDLIFPPPLSVEQCSSEATANYKSKLVSGSHLVDLTGGMGIDTLAFSEHFEHVTYVEQNEILCERMTHNAKVFNKKITVINSSAEAFIATSDFGRSTTFYIDPARRDIQDKKVFRFADCSPNMIELMDRFKSVGCKVLVKAAPLIDLTLGSQELQGVSEIHVVSVKNDCKEVLFLLDFERSVTNVPIHTINITGEGNELFDFSMEEERAASIELSDQKAFLLLPNASILKAGGFKSISAKFHIPKISSSTHFYTSDKPILHFPGRQFEVLTDPITKQLRKVNVISRNHPLTPKQILKKYSLTEGGELYILAFRDQRDKPQMVLARKV